MCATQGKKFCALATFVSCSVMAVVGLDIRVKDPHS